MRIYPTAELAPRNSDARVARILQSHLPPRTDIGRAFATMVSECRKLGCDRHHEICLCLGEVERQNLGLLFLQCKANRYFRQKPLKGVQMNDATRAACIHDILELEPPAIIGKAARSANRKLLKELVPYGYRKKTAQKLAELASRSFDGKSDSDSDSDFDKSPAQAGGLSKSSPAGKTCKSTFSSDHISKSSPIRKTPARSSITPIAPSTAPVTSLPATGEVLKKLLDGTTPKTPKTPKRAAMAAKGNTRPFFSSPSATGSSSPPSPQTFMREVKASLKTALQPKASGSTSNEAGPSKDLGVIEISSSDEDDGHLSSPLAQKRPRTTSMDKETSKRNGKKACYGK